MQKKIAQGAEAVLWREDDTLLKERVKKGYRVSELDSKLRKRRTELEARLLNEARRAGVATPQVLKVEGDKLEMEWIEGKRVKDSLGEENWEEVGQKIGGSIGKLHSYDIVHGDLTTSNMIVKGGRLYLIDFGLGFSSKRIEDKAVDLYLLYHAIEAAHWRLLERMWEVILAAYRAGYGDAEKVTKALDEVEKRGRYKEKIG